LEIVQTRNMIERFGFGPNPLQPFEVVPIGVSVTLKLTKAVLFNLQDAEQTFNFYPNNILYQQLPFIIQVDAPGKPAQDGSPASPHLTHYFLGCWFTNTSVRYSMTDKDDQRLIQTADVKCSRMITQDSSSASSTAANATAALFGGVLAFGNNQAILDDLELT